MLAQSSHSERFLEMSYADTDGLFSGMTGSRGACQAHRNSYPEQLAPWTSDIADFSCSCPKRANRKPVDALICRVEVFAHGIHVSHTTEWFSHSRSLSLRWCRERAV